MSILEQNIINNKQVNKKLLKLEKEFDAKDNSKTYEFKAIIDNVIYKKGANNTISSFYYLVLWKKYSKKKVLKSF